jgi:hypothetical protein
MHGTLGIAFFTNPYRSVNAVDLGSPSNADVPWRRPLLCAPPRRAPAAI